MIITTGVTHITYAFPFVILNTLMPLVSDITLATMMKLNTALLVFDAVFLWALGHLLVDFLFKMCWIFLGNVFYLGYQLQHIYKALALLYVTGLRIWFIVWGVIFFYSTQLVL